MSKKVLPFIVVIGILTTGYLFIKDVPLGSFPPIPPININGAETTFTFTDDNTDETLLIYSSAEDYYGFGSVGALFAIKNISGKAQNIKIAVSTLNGQEVSKISKYVSNTTINYPEVIISETTDEFGSTTLGKIIPARTIVKTNWDEKPLKQFDPYIHTGIRSKSVGTNNTEKESGTYFIDKDEVLYFQTIINFTQEGDFYIEVIGDKGAYGHLI